MRRESRRAPRLFREPDFDEAPANSTLAPELPEG